MGGGIYSTQGKVKGKRRRDSGEELDSESIVQGALYFSGYLIFGRIPGHC
jgi:hypothetical protein